MNDIHKRTHLMPCSSFPLLDCFTALKFIYWFPLLVQQCTLHLINTPTIKPPSIPTTNNIRLGCPYHKQWIVTNCCNCHSSFTVTFVATMSYQFSCMTLFISRNIHIVFNTYITLEHNNLCLYISHTNKSNIYKTSRRKQYGIWLLHNQHKNCIM